VLDYVTPPRKVSTVAVRYTEPRKGTLLPYDPESADEER
jgi:hypothetical protein